MLRNNLIIAWRNLMRHRLHTAINLAGLSLGMAFCLLAWRFASQEWSFDRFHSKADRIYRVYVEAMNPEEGLVRYADAIEFAFAPELETLSPHVEHTVRLNGGRLEKEYRVVRTTFEGSSSDEKFLLVDPAFFKVFDFLLLRGDASTALAERNSVVLSYEMAQRLFGDADPLGQSLTIGNRNRIEDFTITGVAAPVPRTSSIQFNMLLPFENTEFLFRKSPNEWEGSCNAFVLLKPSASPADLAPAFLQLTQIMLQHWGDRAPEDLPGDFSPFHLQPLTDLRSDTSLLQWIGHGVIEPRAPYVSYVLVSIALAVLLMGCINFVNLAIGRASLRAAEVGVRKAAGAGRGQLMCQFIGEAVVLSAVGLGAGCALAALLLPAFNATFSQNLSLGLSEPSMLGALAVLLLLVSLGAGWYPALVLSRLDPLSAIRRSVSMTGVTRFSRVLVGVQLAISVGLITCTLIMYHQLEHIMARDLGLDEDFADEEPVYPEDYSLFMRLLGYAFDGMPYGIRAESEVHFEYADGDHEVAFERKSTVFKPRVATRGIWVILDFGVPVGVRRVQFYPRNTVVATPATPFHNDFLRGYEVWLNQFPSGQPDVLIQREVQNEEPVVNVAIPPQYVRFVKIKSLADVPFDRALLSRLTADPLGPLTQVIALTS